MSSTRDSDVNLCCPICLEKYNTVDHIPVVAPKCAHTICQPCAIKRNSASCVVCGMNSLSSTGLMLFSSYWNKNFALIECLEAMKQVDLEWEQKLVNLRATDDKDIDFLSCGQCGVREKRERMKICCGCAKIKDLKGTVKDREAEVLSATICAFCYTEFHMGHRVINYQTFKVHNLLSSTSSDGIEMVNSMNEMCIQEAQNGAEQIVAWKTKMEGFKEQHRANVTWACLYYNC